MAAHLPSHPHNLVQRRGDLHCKMLQGLARRGSFCTRDATRIWGRISYIVDEHTAQLSQSSNTGAPTSDSAITIKFDLSQSKPVRQGQHHVSRREASRTRCSLEYDSADIIRRLGIDSGVNKLGENKKASSWSKKAFLTAPKTERRRLDGRSVRLPLIP